MKKYLLDLKLYYQYNLLHSADELDNVNQYEFYREMTEHRRSYMQLLKNYLL